jgi:hypothetical protein
MIIYHYKESEEMKKERRSLFGLIFGKPQANPIPQTSSYLQMLNGFASMSDIENAVATYVGGSKIYKIKDPTIIRTALNQYEALDLIKATFRGFELTELGRKMKNDIMLIRK